MNKDVMFSSATDLWETPQSFFDALNEEFGFETDVCALPENAKCARYFTPEDNGLAQTWTGVCWCNPPYGREIGKWVQKAAMSANKNVRQQKWGNRCHAAARADGYKVVSSIHIRKGGNPLYRRSAEIRRRQAQRAVSKHGCGIRVGE